MATSVSPTRACFTYIWTIENCSVMTSINLQSPVFVAHSISKEEMYLRICEPSCLRIALHSKITASAAYYNIDVEYSLLDADGAPLATVGNRSFLPFQSDFPEKWAKIMPNNTLTVRFRMWKRGHEISTTDLCHVRTRLKPFTGTFLWPVEEFSALRRSAAEDFRKLSPDERKVYPLKPLTPKGPFPAMVLYLKGNPESEYLHVDFIFEKGADCVFGCELLVLNANKEVIESQVQRGKGFLPWTILNFRSLISKTKLISDKKLFLPHDTLLLQCTFYAYTGLFSSETEYCSANVTSVVEEEKEVLDFGISARDVYDSLQFKEFFFKEGERNDFLDSFFEEKKYISCKSSCPLRTVLMYLHSEAAESDASLRIGTKLYPVHKNILSSRIPVLMKDMKDNIIEINNVNENTLLSLLQYIYADSVRDVLFENALDLYKAAAYYQLLDLKERCSDLLIMNLSKVNLYDIQSLANEYQDKKMENVVQNFIHDK